MASTAGTGAKARAIRPSRLRSLEEHAAVYAAVVASGLDAVIVVDEDGIVVTINPAAETTFGYTRLEAVGRSIGELIVPDHLRKAHEAGFNRYRTTRKAHVLGKRVEMEARHKDGRIIPVELAITEVVLADRRLFTASLRDLTAARAAAVEIERQRDALHQSEKLAALGSLLAGVAHELNNPLSVVLGQATMMREEAAQAGGDAAIRVRAEKIEAAAERCARVVRAFLAIARQRKAEMRPVGLATLVDSAIELLLYNLNSAGVDVVRAYDDALPDAVADADQVQQIVVNLLVNAAQALETVDGKREIRVSLQSAEGNVRLVVADNGPGVPRAVAQRIFEPFFTTKPQGAGTGIGLSVSRGLAQSQGGALELLAPGKGGAAFMLTLPAADMAADDIAGSVEAPLGIAGTASRRRAIVIDDEAEIAILLAETFRKAGYVCDVATSGGEGQAMIAARGESYDAVVCDLRMPDIDGPRLYRWLRGRFPVLADRTVFITGDALGPAAGKFLAETQRPVLEKPFAPAEVVRLAGEFPQRIAAG
jgi:PAS domain S-box-containing protein